MWQESRKCMGKFGPALVVALIACSAMHGQEVKTDYLPTTDFSKYRTYKWVDLSGGAVPLPIRELRHPNQILDTHIKQSIDSQLTGKGFTKVESDKPDLLVDYDIGAHQERQWTASGMRDLGWPGGMDTGMATATSSTINQGTIVLNIYDAATKQLIWTGFATKEVNLSKNQEKNRKNLDKATAKLLKDFPPGRK